MFVPIANTPRPYAWGSHTAIAELLGVPAGGGPEAELWFGAHHGSPSRILDPACTAGAATLEDWIRADPAAALGRAAGIDPPRLPFLMKVLAADRPLSLQAHPDAAQARAGFAREEQAGPAPQDPDRDYKDPFPKPEMLLALGPFDALCGFAPPERSRARIERLAAREGLTARARTGLARLAARLAGPGPGTRRPDAEVLAGVVAWLLGDGAEGLADAVVAAAAPAPGRPEPGGPASPAAHDPAAAQDLPAASPAAPRAGIATPEALVRLLARHHPADPGIVLALLLNVVHLEPGEALYLPPGSIHAYLSGLGIEIMTASDNVVRGGLTEKHVNVPELLRILDCTPGGPTRLAGTPQAPGVRRYRPAADFALTSIDPPSVGARASLEGGPALLLCLSGTLDAAGRNGAARMRRGECRYVTPDEAEIEVRGAGRAVLATGARA